MSERACEYCDGTGDASHGDDYVKCATCFGTGVVGFVTTKRKRVVESLNQWNEVEREGERAEGLSAMGCSGSCGGSGCPVCGGRR